jgi:hypothetical protein
MFSTTLLPFTSFHTICTLCLSIQQCWCKTHLVINGHQNIKCILVSKTISWYFYQINLCEYFKNKCLHKCERLGGGGFAHDNVKGSHNFFCLDTIEGFKHIMDQSKWLIAPKEREKKEKIPLDAHPPKLINIEPNFWVWFFCTF